MKVLTDEDVRARVTPEFARSAMRDAVVAAHQGTFTAPPRTTTDLAGRRMTFTCGAVEGRWFGYRSYTAPGSSDEDQVVVVHDASTGRVTGLALGAALGPRRSGAIGAVALEALAPARPTGIALLGAGTQAWHQLWALPETVRRLPVRIHSRAAAHRERFAERAGRELDLDVRPVDSVEEALAGANVILLATSSPTPVLSADDIPRGAFVATAGPKQVAAAEFDPDLTRDADLVVTDSPAQLLAYDPPHALTTTGDAVRAHHLGAVLAGAQAVPDGTRVFLNNGLAGTEAWLLHAMLADHPSQAPGPL